MYAHPVQEAIRTPSHGNDKGLHLLSRLAGDARKLPE